MITSLSPLDGRYKNKVSELAAYFSEVALMKYRVMVEISFFMALSAEPGIKELPAFTDKELAILNSIISHFDEREAERIKAIEKTTNHDVKAVEYYLKEKLEKTSLKKHLEFIHFACTSEDINNLAYALMMKGATEEVMVPAFEELLKSLKEHCLKWLKTPLLALTHGQPASPTTVGKEFLVFVSRLSRQLEQLKKQEYLGKLNGATGNFNAHLVAYPKVKWKELSKKFVQNLGLIPNLYTTQIEPHDFQAELYDNLARMNTILIGFSRDMWGYISRGVFKQKTVKGEVGSSTMPHKVNPIDFENAEGNFGLANALLRHFAEKLPLSRFQRDLTDSTVQRNIGIAFGYTLLAYKSFKKGLEKCDLNKKIIQEELDQNPEVLAEAVQTILRKNGVKGGYEKLKKLTRGKALDLKALRAWIQTLKLPPDDKARLMKLKPETYIGLADQLK